jgi:transcriptional regulator with XRE-family HTH domain
MTSSEISQIPLDINHPVLATLQPLVDALGCSVIDATQIEAADIPLGYEGELIAAVRLPDLHGALARLIDSVEREMGQQLPDMNREQKQLAIRLLDERGAFTLRRAVEDVADAMGVSRITVYNYLNALHR